MPNYALLSTLPPMIPYKITLQNFLSYGSTPQTISFENYHLICLSGKNGHGKSALLDALTWVLWGQARKTTGTSKPDEGLLRLGARDMRVVFEFFAGGKQYRVRREFGLRMGNKQHTGLDIGVFDEESQQYRSLTEKTIRRTQAVIEESVGLDYETYVNSAFLRQGHANEFSQKSPKERKKILATILGVDKYDALQTFALEKARGCTQKIRVLQELQAQDEEELSHENELKTQHAQYEKQLAELEKKITAAVFAHQHAQRASEQYAVRKKELASRQQELATEDVQLRERTAEWGSRVQAWRKLLQDVREAGGADDMRAQIAALRIQEQAMRSAQHKKLQSTQELAVTQQQRSERMQSLEGALRTQREQLGKEQQKYQAAYDQAVTQHKHLVAQTAHIAHELQTVDTQLGVLQTRNEMLTKELCAHEKTKRIFDKRRAFYTAYVPRAKWLYEQCAQMQKKQEMVSDKSGASCPLCEQILSAKRKLFLRTKMDAEQHIVAHQYERLHGVLGRLKKQLVVDHEVVKKYDQKQQERLAIAGQIEQLLARQTQLKLQHKESKNKEFFAAQLCDKAEKEVVQSVQKIEAHDAHAKKHIADDEVLQNLQKKIEKLQKENAAYVYDKTAHETLEKQIAECEKKSEALSHAREQAGVLREQRSALTRQKIQLQQDRAALIKKQKALAGAGLDDTVEKELTNAVKKAAQEEAAVRTQREEAVAGRSAVQTSLTLLATRRTAYDARRKQIAAYEEEKSDFSILATAWSKNGIQALLIEQAIPELEQEANELLARLTYNQAQIFIESLRDLKGGGARETLDIKIADTMGVRPYEMFSGGEAFRIDFALRIAISKLLARRAGAALQVLIIDEGFGSQDEEGLSRLMQSLYAVQEDFAKIIIVSHLPDFKENFPVHFVVNKGATGSTIRVEERG